MALAAILVVLTADVCRAQVTGGGILPGNRPWRGGIVTQPIKLPDGTAAAPSVTFASDATLGLYKPAANQLGVSLADSLSSLFVSGGILRTSFLQGFSGGALYLGANALTHWDISTSGHLLAYADATYDIGATGATRPRNVYLSDASITAGAGTGVTVVSSGYLRQQVYVVTIDKTALVCAATTCDVTIATLPAKTWVIHALADETAVFACASVCTTGTLSFTLGKTAGGNQYLVSWDADAATGQFGDAAAELGASLTEATIPTAIGDLGAWASTTTVSLRLTSGTGNIGNGAATNLSTGSVTLFLTTVRY